MANLEKSVEISYGEGATTNDVDVFMSAHQEVSQSQVPLQSASHLPTNERKVYPTPQSLTTPLLLELRQVQAVLVRMVNLQMIALSFP